MHRKLTCTNSSGFTLVDLVVIVALIGLLTALLLPMILRARESSRRQTCQNNLRQIGVSIHLFADSDRKERFCTGAADYRRDGCVDTWGWVADTVNQGAVIPNELLCPSSPIRGSETLNDLLNGDTKDAKDLCPLYRLSDGLCGQSTYSGLSGGSSSVFGGTLEKTQERAALIARGFLDQGYNSNYSASWHLVRSITRYDFQSNIMRTKKGAGLGLQGLGGTYGPLTRIVAESGPVAADRLPFLGCGAASEGPVLDRDLSYGPRSSNYDPWAGTNRSGRVFIKSGEQLSESFNMGPSTWNPTTREVQPIGQGVEVMTQLGAERLDSVWDAPELGNNLYLQDTRSWYSWHGSKNNAACNILFSDGSVKDFADTNGDKFLNPGFPVPKGLADSEYDKIGYRDDTIEIDEAQMFKGLFLIKLMTTYFE